MKYLKIIEFNTPSSKYIFDGVTGTVMPVDDIILDAIKLFQNYDKSSVYQMLKDKYNDEIKIKSAIEFVTSYSSETGAFYYDAELEKSKWEVSKNTDPKSIQNILNEGYLQQIILNVTEDCNMRCKYCYLSESYYYTRNRTNKTMSSNTAISALKWYFNNIKAIKEFNPGKKCGITFYGGESLLNFNLIYECMEYSKLHCPVTPIFSITTNGTLLNDEIVDYLVENDVNITVSFDGTKENHDRNRVFDDNNGSYDIVLNNIISFRRRYPDYNKINLAGVYDLATKLKDNVELFNDNYNLPQMALLSMVSDNGTDYYNSIDKNELDKFISDSNQLLQEYVYKKIKGERLSSYLTLLFELPLISVLFRTRYKDTKPQFLPFTSACIPGMKVSIRVDGTIDICEKVNTTFPIGNVLEGYNYSNMAKLLDKYALTVTSKCSECAINRQCGMCFALCCANGDFSSPICNGILETYKRNLSIVYTVLESNPKAYDNFLYRDEWALNI